MNAALSNSRVLHLLVWAGLLIGSAAFRTLAVELTQPPRVVQEKDKATIQWKTDVECGTRLNYGLSPDGMKLRADGAVSAIHTVTLGSLAPGTTYYFSVGSARQKLATGTFTTTGTGTSSPLIPSPASEPKPASSKIETKPLPARDPIPPPTRQTWGNLQSLVDHYQRHGHDLGSTSPDDYAAKAWLFLQQAKAGSWPMKLDDFDGTVRVWNGQKGAFGAYSRDGKTKTYFKPGNPGYWQRQPGRLIKPDNLPFK